MARKITITADASQFKSETAAAAKSVANVAASAEDARKRIVESYKMQVQAAKEVGASQKELEAIQRRTSEMLSKVSDDSADRYIKSLDRMEERTRKFNAARQELAKVVPINVSEHYEPPPQSKASASIRALGGTPSVRAAESFASSVPFLSKAFDFAFPAIGAAALLTELANGVNELIKMKKEATELPEHLRDAFEGLNAPLHLSVDNLRKANDELDISIAKLEHKPANTFALSLDEARINADRLADSTDRAAGSIKTLLEENRVGFKEWLITGQTSTGPFSEEINKRMKELRDLQRDNRDALRSGIDTPEAAQVREANITAKLQGLHDYAQKNRKDLQSFDNGSQTSNINILAGVEDWAASTLDEQAQQKRNTALKIKKTQLEHDKALSQQANEAQRKAMSDTKQLWEQQLSEYNSTGTRTIEEERKFWYDRINAVQQGSELYDYATKKANDLLKQANEQRRKQADDLRKINDQWQAQELRQLTQALLPGAQAQSKGIVDARNTGISLRDAQRSAYYSGAEAGVVADEQAGRLTRLDAAMQLQTLHTQQYNEQLKELQDNLAAVKADDPEAEANRNRIKQQIVGLNERYGQQSARDSAAVNPVGSLGSVGVRNTLDEFVIATRDAATQMRSITLSILGSLNQSLSATIVGGRSNWAETFRGVGQQIANSDLQKLEGSALGALGFGKADGSRGNPFHVIMDSGLPGGFGDPGIGGKSGRIFSSIASFFTGRAIGGDVDANGTYLVGERGPEVLRMGPQSGKITPNNMLGGGDSHTYHIDARGAQDPAAVEAAVNRAMDRRIPGIMAGSVRAVSERNRRLPPTARR